MIGLLGLTPDARAADDPCRDRLYTGDLAALFIPPRELGADWDSVREAPSNPADDPELRAAGVSASHSLHYTRARQGRSEVCSLEIWAFANGAAAQRAQATMDEPLWRLGVRGNLLITMRGVTLSRSEGFRPGLLPECQRLADLTEAGASALLGCTGAHPRDGAD